MPPLAVRCSNSMKASPVSDGSSRCRRASPDDRSPMVYACVYSGAVRRARTSRTSWSVCVAGAASVDVLESGGLLGGPVGAGPEAGGGARVATVDVTAEGDGACGRATRKERRELDALRVVPGDLDRRARVQVGGAHVDVDSGGDAQPAAPLDAGLCLEVLAVGALDGCLGEQRVTVESAAARSNAA